MQQNIANLIVKSVNVWVLAIFALLGVLSPAVGLFTSAAISARWISEDSGWARFAAKIFSFTLQAKSNSLPDPNAKSSKIVTGLLFVGTVLLLSGCAGTFEESTGKIAVASVRKVADPAVCLQISNRARWEKGLAFLGAGLTGSAGIAAWPVETKDGRMGLAIGGTLLAGGTVMVLTLWQEDAAAYIEAGCATPKEQSK